MTLENTLSQELDHAVEQASATAAKLSLISTEIHAVLRDDHRSPAVHAQVLEMHSKRAARALISLAGLVGRIGALARHLHTRMERTI